MHVLHRPVEFAIQCGHFDYGIFLMIEFFLCSMFSLMCDDPWAKLEKTFPRTPVINQILQKVTTFDQKKRQGALTVITGVANVNGLYLISTRNPNAPIRIDWKSIDACGQTLWCPGRDTNLWIDALNIEITLSDNKLSILRMCKENSVKTLTPKVFKKVIYGRLPINNATENNKLDLFSMGCSETSYF